MGNYSIPITLTLLLTATIVWFNMPKKDVIDANCIIVGTNAEYQPFTWVKDGQIVGLDIDIIQAIAQRLGKKVHFVDMSFSMLVPETLIGRIHVIAAGMTPTPEREKQLLFTHPYITRDPLMIITLAENGPATMNDLTNKVVVVNEGYTADLWASEQPNINLLRVDNPSSAFLTLHSKRADAFIAASLSVQEYFKQHNKDAYACTTINGAGDRYALAVSKQHPKIYADIEKELSLMEKDGTLNKIKQKWGAHD